MEESIKELESQAREIIIEVCELSGIKNGETLLIGCSTSEIIGEHMGTNSSLEVAQAIFRSIYKIVKEKDIILAVQCCEHLNRCIIIESKDSDSYEKVNVIPHQKAGGAFATIAYKTFSNPVALEEIKADVGIDIGGVLIGMNLKKVAVPLRMNNKHLGKAIVIAARTRAKYIGGPRAIYEEL